MPDCKQPDERAADALESMRDDELTRLLDDVRRIADGIGGIQDLAVRAFAPPAVPRERRKPETHARTIAELRERLKAARDRNSPAVTLSPQTVVAVLVLLSDVEPLP